MFLGSMAGKLNLSTWTVGNLHTNKYQKSKNADKDIMAGISVKRSA